MQLPDFLASDDGGFIHLVGHRIGLNHVVRGYVEGQSPEMLVEEFPTLPLALIHKVIAFYLENQSAVDQYMVEHDREVDRQMAASRPVPSVAELRRRLEKMRAAEATPPGR
jgi:uncharacterized protein (DUF433 family)